MAKHFVYTLILLFLLTFNCELFSQESQSDWKRIDSLMNLGLVESVLPDIESRLIDAKKVQDFENHLKAVLLKINVLQQKGAEIKQLIDLLNNEIKESYFPANSILHYLLAESYHNYYNRSRWEINNRTNLESKNLNIEFWTANQIKDQIKNSYLKSIQDSDSLYLISIDEIQGILKGNFLSKKNNASLYEVLAKGAIRYFGRQDKNYNHPFKDRLLTLLNPHLSFINIEIDSSSGPLIALDIYQKLLRHHIKSGNLRALIQTDLERLKEVKRLFLNDEYDLNYKNALQDLINLYPMQASISEVYYELARIHSNHAVKFDPFTNKGVQWEYKKAAEICRFVIDKFPNSDGAGLCELMLEKIETPFVGIDMKSVQLPNTPILASLNFQNCSNVYFKLIKLNYIEAKKLISFSRDYSYLEAYLKKIPYNVWQENLPIIEDFQRHHAQIRIPDLDLGFYVLLASNSPSFDKESQVHLNSFTVSELSLISRNDGIKGKDYFMLDRKSGHPMKGVKLSLYKEQFDRSKDKYSQVLERSFISDKNGFIHIDKEERYIAQQVLTFKKDTLFEGYARFSIYNQEKRKLINTQFFTDRKIYRPGQIIYFKGILSENNEGKRSVLRGKPTKIDFLDVNWELIESRKLISNEYGSFNGSFIIPKSALNGKMRIGNDYGEVYLQVEEYKRPNFEILFDTLKEQYQINDSIKVSGFVKSFSGIPLGNTHLKYVITRLSYDVFNRNFSPRTQEKQIASGEGNTKDNGTFEIDFFASAESKKTNSENQFYSYKLKVELRDINGETQSNEIMISVSNVNLFLETINKEAIDKQSTKGFPISAKNINGQIQAVNVTVSIFKLNSPERAFKKRTWSKPDVFLTDQESFYTYFPNDQYANEADILDWKISEQLFQAEINTAEQTEVEIVDFPYWDDGKYKLILKAKDQFDVEVIKEVYFTLFDSKSSSLPYPKLDWFFSAKGEYDVGDTYMFYAGSAAKEASMLYEILHKGKVVLSNRIRLNANQKQFKFPIPKSLKGLLNVQFLFVHDNEVYQHSEQIKVVDSKEKIQLRLNTFRSHLSPNDKEEWEIHISSPKGIVQAELVAAMTDYSLEKIVAYRWDFKKRSNYYPVINWKSGRFNLSFSRSFGKFAYRYFGEINNPIPYFKKRHLKRDGVLKIRGASSISSNSIFSEQDTGSSEVLVQYDSLEKDSYAYVDQDVNNDIRTNFNETAFFYPNLKTDKNGNINLKFTAPESLSKWKVKLFAHTKDLRNTYLEKEIITQKELMLSPNLPRFVREGDTLFFSTKISNLSGNEIDGQVDLQLFNAISDQKLFAVLIHDNEEQNFKVGANSSVNKRWKLRIPKNVNAIKYRLVASSENHSDGEERIIPVLSNRILVTESLPLFVNANESKEILFRNLINSGSDSLLEHHQLKLEFTSNPIWYAILALPYIDDDQKENSLSLFNRFYANSMASFLMNCNPEIEEIFKQLKGTNSQALESILSKNEDLKSILLQETPWLLDAKNESEQKQKLALFFDRNTLEANLDQNLKKLLNSQLTDGSWAWYKGGRGSLYITQEIISGLLKLKQILNKEQGLLFEKSLESAISYIKGEFIRDYNKLKETHRDYLDKDYLKDSHIQFLYTLSHYIQEEGEQELDLANSYFLNQAQQFWMNKSNYLQAMIAIIMHRKADEKTANLIIQSLIERSIVNAEYGRYWSANNTSFWYQRPIETQSQIIETFHEIGIDKMIIEELKKNLLKQKQTQLWENPKTSVRAVNALFSDNISSLKSNAMMQVRLGGRKVGFSKSEIGSGFVEKRWDAQGVKSSLGRIQLINTKSTISWGAMHWQYFQDLNMIEKASTGLKIEKQLYLKQSDKNGAHLVPINSSNSIKLGDRIVSRILISADRDFDFVHLKDLRAAAFEPTQILSSHQYQNGLYYYASTTDVATHYYIDHLNKGNYVIEIEMIASQLGTFSNGISTIQCLYAPEFNAHSEGQEVVIK